jgi:hypothetical protein
MKEFWNQRYSEQGYAYGTEPNEFFKEALLRYKEELLPDYPRLLMPAEGEGRNAVYAAGLGFEVTAFDVSEQARVKALQLAKERDIPESSLNYHIGDCLDLEADAESYDALGLIYAHFPPALKTPYYPKLHALLKPGGWVFLEGFSLNNLPYRQANPKVGGPADPELLFTKEQIEMDFKGFDLQQLEEVEVELNEGRYHVGTAMVIRLIARKSV